MKSELDRPRSPRASREGVAPAIWVAWLLLLLLPLGAGLRLAAWIDWRVVAGVPIAMSVITYLAFRSDKRRAEVGEWRIPESTLHLLEFLCGWPGAFLAQRKFRHKTSKRSYQVVFWIVVLFHQAIALDCLVGWRLSRGILHEL